MKKVVLLLAILSAASVVYSIDLKSNVQNLLGLRPLLNNWKNTLDNYGENENNGNTNETDNSNKSQNPITKLINDFAPYHNNNDDENNDKTNSGNDVANGNKDDNSDNTTENNDNNIENVGSNGGVNNDSDVDNKDNIDDTTNDVGSSDEVNQGKDDATDNQDNTDNTTSDDGNNEGSNGNDTTTAGEDNNTDDTTNDMGSSDVNKGNDDATDNQNDNTDNTTSDAGNKDKGSNGNDTTTAGEDDNTDATTNDVGSNDESNKGNDDATDNQDDNTDDTTSGAGNKDEGSNGNNTTTAGQDDNVDDTTNDVGSSDESTRGNDDVTDNQGDNTDNTTIDEGNNGNDTTAANTNDNIDNTTNDDASNDSSNSGNDDGTISINDNIDNTGDDETDGEGNDSGNFGNEGNNNNNDTNDVGNNDESNGGNIDGIINVNDNTDNTTNVDGTNGEENKGNDVKPVNNDSIDLKNSTDDTEDTNNSSSELNGIEDNSESQNNINDSSEIESESPPMVPNDGSFVPIVFKKRKGSYRLKGTKLTLKKVKPSNNEKDVLIQIKKGRIADPYESQQSKPGFFRRLINRIKRFFGFGKKKNTDKTHDNDNLKNSKPGFFRRIMNRIKRIFMFGKSNNKKSNTKNNSNNILSNEPKNDAKYNANDNIDLINTTNIEDASNEDEGPINPNDLTRMDKDSLKDVLETEVEKYKDVLLYVYDDKEKPIKLNLDIPDLYALNLTQDLDKSTVLFHLYTRNNKFNYDPLEVGNTEIFHVSHFIRSRPTVFITHGYLCSNKGPSVTMIRNAYLKTRDVNVIVVDWSAISSGNYIAARLLVPAMGKYIGKMINFLIENGMKAETTTLIGHSLGAQIMSLTGQFTSQRVNHTIGLDPARILFTVVDKDQRLSSDDANHVEVIHTNAGILGFSRPTGDYDFYPNGGTLQNGCTNPKLYDACSHNRSFKYLAEQLLRLGPEYYALECESYEKFLTRQCTNNNMIIMGELERVPVAKGKYFLQTRATPPYGVGPNFRRLTH